MGLLDKVKDVTGVGLGAKEQYARAYEKGVFLQPPDYAAASKHFLTASEKFEKEANAGMARRAKLNSLMYDLARTKSNDLISPLIKAMDRVPEIERIGSQKDLIPTDPLIVELKSYELELQALAKDNPNEKMELFKSAGNTLITLGTGQLYFAEYLNLDGPVNRAMTRSAYYTAMSDYFMALTAIDHSPEDAHDYLQKATVGFSQAEDKEWMAKSQIYVTKVGSKRHCWMCDREMTGEDFFYSYYPATIKPYHKKIVESLKQDSGMVDERGRVAVCTVCGTAIENQADRYAQKRMKELKEWIEPILNNINSNISNLNQRVEHLEKLAHRH